MKPTTAAKKLGVLLTAMPAELQEREITRSEIAEWTESAPEWLAELRRNGPHPRPVVAAKLGVSISGLARGGVDEALTTEQIKALLEQMPEWLVTERATQAKVRDENARLKQQRASKNPDA
ncbi:DUF5997 family protein [Herbiconiux sp. L3-i23]|uniref:DUF5997 family protein n=1 Tax=Herbiconiux sp. L3-i23 TaxID=2905871 RepID=UPI00206B9A13|nr:DUF5997 family protein [Herbiconiux sp. L3-i23]BDI22145.1 hypothetical protein L3i23_09210 [Herbiconiux sp. L3-i23]